MIRVDASGGGVDDLLHFGAAAGSEQHPVESEIGGTGRLVEVDVAAPTVVGSEVEHHRHALDGRLGRARSVEVRLDELDLPRVEMPPNIVEAATAEIVDHAHQRAP